MMPQYLSNYNRELLALLVQDKALFREFARRFKIFLSWPRKKMPQLNPFTARIHLPFTAIFWGQEQL
jgi:hypothetical protein